MKKLLIALATVLVAVLSGVIVYFAIPKDESIDLNVTVKNIIVEVDEEAVINYTVSHKDAFVTFEIKDKNIASIKSVNSQNRIHGIVVGETEIVIKAKYKGVSADATAKVYVVAKANSENPGESEPTIPDDPNETPDDPGNDDEGGSDTPIEQAPKIIFNNLKNCTVEGNKIFIGDVSYSLVQITTENGVGSITFEYDTTKMSISLNDMIGNNTYKIVVYESGEFDLKITIDENIYQMIVVKTL